MPGSPGARGNRTSDGQKCADGDEADPGFNLTYGVDLYPVRPLVVSGDMDVGTLGGTFFQRFESVQLHGLLAGVRIWF